MRVENLKKSFDGQILFENLSFSLEQGVTCVFAPSGTGKTTLLRILLGLETADAGVIHDGAVRWGTVFQEDRLLERLSAEENLRFALGQVPAAAEALLEELGLGDVGEKPVEEFSGGMKRRLALCRALLCPGDALMLDEPFTGLDVQSREACLRAIARAAEEKPVLLVTHEARDAEFLNAAVVKL